MTEDGITNKIEKLGRQLSEFHLNMSNILEDNNRILKDILNYQNNERQMEIYTELEVARTIISKVIKIKSMSEKSSEEFKDEVRIEEIIIRLQEIITKIENKRYITIEDLKRNCKINTITKLTIDAPFRIA